jgi:CRISPR-associated endonuclease Cas2
MVVIAFDLDSHIADWAHPKGSRQAYRDNQKTLQKHGFERVQWSVFAAKDENLAELIGAVTRLQTLPWFHRSVKNIRAFRMEAGTDLTGLFKMGLFKMGLFNPQAASG